MDGGAGRLSLHIWKIVLLALALLAITGHTAAAQLEGLVVQESNSYQKLGGYMETFIGPRDNGSLEQGQNLHAQGKFVRLDKDNPDYGVTDAGIWIRFSLNAEAASSTQWVLDTGRPFLRDIRIWAVAGGETQSILEDGRDFRFDHRYHAQRILVSREFAVAPGVPTVIWTYYESDSTSTLPLRIYPADQVYRVAVTADLTLTVFHTIALIFLIFMASFAFALSSRVSVFYSGFFACVLAYNAQLAGTLFENFWPGLSGWNAVASHPFGMGAIIFALLMGREFAKLGHRRPILNKVVLAVAAVSVVYVFAPVVLPLVATKKLAGPIVLTFLVLQVIVSVVALIDKVPGARFYVLGSVTLFGYIGVFTLLTQGHIPVGAANKELIIRYGQLLDGFIFCLAVVRQTWVLRNDARDSREFAETAAMELATARHDLRQPLFSLKMALTASKPGSGATDQVARSIQYLESLLEEEPGKNGKPDQPDWQAQQSLPSDLSDVLGNIETMFGSEAKESGIELRIVNSSVSVSAPSIALLRVLANLVSNTIQHSGGSRVLVGARRCGNTISIHCIDDGAGFAASQFEKLQGRYAKSPESQGEGFGLSIASEICGQSGWRLHSHPDAHRGAHLIVSGVGLAGT